ncbi:MAG: type 4a pilus biogenesis protein PilO [Candidatus Omnitrophota bacterium]
MDKLIDFGKLKTREKILVVGLTMVVGFGLYIQLIHKPFSKKVTRYQFQIKKFESRIKDLKANFPQIKKQEQDIESLKLQSEELLKEIGRIEKSLPAQKNVSQLLGEFAHSAKDIKLISIRQKLELGEEYSRIFIELKFDGSYKESISYIKEIESISPFLIIEELNISQLKGKKTKKEPCGRMVVSTLLGKVSFVEQFKAKEAESTIQINRDIFVSEARPVSTISKIELKLEGITYGSKGSTAIINGGVMKVGSEIGNYKVKQILSDTVLLASGAEEYVLSIER